MSLAPRTIAVNTAFYFTALTFQKLLSFFYFSYIARSLGTVLTGRYFYALTIAAIIMVFMDLGISPVLIREASREKNDVGSLVGTVLSLKLLLSAVCAIVFVALVHFTVPELIMRQLLYIALGIALCDSFAAVLFGVARSRQNLIYESVAAMLFQIVVVILGVSALRAGYPLPIILLALLSASFINLLYAGVIVFVRYKVIPRWRGMHVLAAQVIRLSIPFGIAAVFVKVYAYLDTLLLRYFAGDHAVGIYSVAYKVTFAFQFIPLAFVAALYPAFSYLWQHDKQQLQSVFNRSLDLLLIVSLPIVTGIIAIASHAIPSVYTVSFAGSVTPLMILITSLPFLFINFPLGSLLNACNRQTRQTINLGTVMAINAIINLLVIPFYGPTGAAVASTVSTIIATALGLWSVRGLVHIDTKRLLRVIGQLLVLCAGIVVVVRVSAVLTSHWYIALLPAIIFYCCGILFFKLVSVADIRLLLARKAQP